MSHESPKCYLVRTIPGLIEKSIVGIGWSDYNFSKMETSQQVIDAIKGDYGIGRRANQIRRFFAITDGDIIVAPLAYSIAIGRAKGGIFFDPEYIKFDRANQRRVVFKLNENNKIVTLPRGEFSEAFQRRIRVQGMTVNDLSEFEPEIMTALSKVESGKDYSWKSQFEEKEQKITEAFKAQLLSHIQTGNTNLQTGGIGLEHLVRELLILDGYDANIMSKRAMPGMADADIKASRPDRCSDTSVLVQVKHHSGFSNTHGIDQLKEIQKLENSEYADHQLVFLTSGSLTSEAYQYAEDSNIKVIDGPILADWIMEHINRLSLESRQSLCISSIPTIITP